MEQVQLSDQIVQTAIDLAHDKRVKRKADSVRRGRSRISGPEATEACNLLFNFLQGLQPDELRRLTALAWLGRGRFDRRADPYKAALSYAKRLKERALPYNLYSLQLEVFLTEGREKLKAGGRTLLLE